MHDNPSHSSGGVSVILQMPRRLAGQFCQMESVLRVLIVRLTSQCSKRMRDISAQEEKKWYPRAVIYHVLFTIQIITIQSKSSQNSLIIHVGKTKEMFD